MQNDARHKYFAFVLRLRKLLQLQEDFEDSWKKLPLPQRLLWVLPLASFAAAFFAMLLPALRRRLKKEEHIYE